MAVLLLAGPPAVGHNTIADGLALRRERVCVIDGDDVRAMTRSPGVSAGGGAEWERRYRLCIRSMCALARLHDADGSDVILLDVVEPYVLPLFRDELEAVSALSVVLLTADAHTLVARDRARDPVPPSAAQDAWHLRIRHLHRILVEASGAFDHRVDSTRQSVDDTVESVAVLMNW